MYSYPVLSNKFPGGKKITQYRRTIVEEYAEYVLDDGLIRRIKRYTDFFCSPNQLYAIEEHYENRKDAMIKVIRNLGTGEITEYFRCGREDQVKSMTLKFGSILNNS